MLRPNQFSGPAGQTGNEQENNDALENSDEENDLAARWKEIKQMRNQIDELRGIVEDIVLLIENSRSCAGKRP